MDIPFEIEGLGMFFAMLDSTPRQVNTYEKLAQMQAFVDSAALEHNRLMRFAEHTAAHPDTAALAANMAEAYGGLACALAGKHHELRRVLMGTVPTKVAS